jgi:hypothetical protein
MTINDHFEAPRFTGPDGRDQYLEWLGHNARYLLRNTRLDLDLFLALSPEERAARWRQWDRATKWQACALMLRRRNGDWEVEAIERWIAHYDSTWGAA